MVKEVKGTKWYGNAIEQSVRGRNLGRIKCGILEKFLLRVQKVRNGTFLLLSDA